MKAEVVDDLERLERWYRAWDALACEAGTPFASPAWMLSWWQEIGHLHGKLRAIVLTEGADLVGVVPLWVQRSRSGLFHYRMMASDVSDMAEPLSAEGPTERFACRALEALLGCDPPLDSLNLNGLREHSPWPRLLAQAWPAKSPWTELERADSAPQIRMEGRRFDDWLRQKGGRYRQKLRKLEEAGGSLRLLSDGQVSTQHLEALLHLHLQRWRGRGGSAVYQPGLKDMLTQVAQSLEGTGRFQLWVIDNKDSIVAAKLVLRAGDEIVAWLTGFDEAWARFSPGILTSLAAIEHAWATGAEGFNLGVGAQDYKLRLADSSLELRWWRLVRRGWRPLHSPTQLVPWPARRRVRQLRAAMLDQSKPIASTGPRSSEDRASVS